jgi:hypothetical protein
MSLSYYASQLSEKIGETPEGFLICRDCVIARTGSQKYAAAELPPEVLKEIGLNDLEFDVYRSPEEVFRPATMASFEGKSITDGHPPAGQFIDAANVDRFEYGHVQNVRRGIERLESGEEPLIADIVIKREPLMSDVRRRGKRELSCGYGYELALDGDRLVQRSIVGNHVAVVPRGRAGAEARIEDSALEEQERKEAGRGSTGERKETIPVKKNWRAFLFGRGLQAFAKDATPEEMEEVTEALKEEKPNDPKPDAKAAEEKAAKEKADKEAAEKKAAGDAAEKNKTMDHGKRRADDCRGRIRDRIASCEDTDLDELEMLLEEFFSEEAQEPEHQTEGGDAASMDDAMAMDVDFYWDAANQKAVPVRGSKGYSKKKAGDRAKDGFIEPVGAEPAAASTDAIREVLAALRPIVARSNDKALRDVFNGLADKHNQARRGAGAGTGGQGYRQFAGAAAQPRATDTSNPRAAENERLRMLQARADAIGRGEKPEEVKK